MADIQQIIALYRQCGSYSQVARELQISRNTVKKYLHLVDEVRSGTRQDILPDKREINQPRRIVTDELLSLIHSLLEENKTHPRKQRLNGWQIWEKTTKSGYSVSYPTVKRIIADWKKTQISRQVYILQEPEPGYRAEFDWCELTLQIKGIWTKLHMVVMVLTYSLYRFARLYQHETQQEVIDAHIHFFNEIQAVPRYIFYDNLRSVYDYPHKTFQKGYLQFASHYGFSHEVCNPSSPHEKGTDEESVSYVRRKVFGERNQFESIEGAQLWLETCLHEINTQPVYKRVKTPTEALKDEMNDMLQLPSLEYSNIIIKTAAISKYSLITFERNHYSVPDTYPKKSVQLVISVDHIDIVGNNQVISSHKRLYGKGLYSLDICHYLKTFSRKPGALLHSKVIHQVNHTLQALYHDYYLERPLEFIQILNLLNDSPLESLLSALETLQISHIVPGLDTLRMVLSPVSYPPCDELESFNLIHVDEPDLTIYDTPKRCLA